MAWDRAKSPLSWSWEKEGEDLHKKSFTFGMGTGILILTAVFFFVYGYQKKTLEAAAGQTVYQISEQEIINQAKKLGMAYYMDDSRTAHEYQMTDQQIIEKAIDLGMTFEVGEPETTYTEEQARDINSNRQNTTKSGTVIVDIPEGCLASQVASILAREDLIDDAESFIKYLSENNSTKILGYGNFNIPYGAGYDEILDIIKR